MERKEHPELNEQYSWCRGTECDVSQLIGYTIEEISSDDIEIVFKLTDGTEYLMYHAQDCCETVEVEDICGDLDDLLGSPILMAEEVCSECGDADCPESDYESYTWTFYKLATRKGYVTIRWLGVSNGFYSESVSFARIK